MKLLKTTVGAAVLGGILALSSLALAADKDKPAKPYPLKTCLVSDEKFGGEMGKPYVFVEKGQEIKLCCKSCLKDFQKDPAKYLKKLAESKKSEKEGTSGAPANNHGEHHH